MVTQNKCQLQLFLRKWEELCEPQNIHLFSSDNSGVFGSVTDQFDSGRQYCSLNCYSSAISSCHLPIDHDEFSVEQHQLVSRLLKDAFHLHPQQLKCVHTCEVHEMLEFLRSLGPNNVLTLEQLTRKLAVLLALVVWHAEHLT